jgi:hypothetical protein
MMNGRGRRYPEPIRARNGRAGPGPASGSTETVGRGDGTAVSVRVAVTRHSRCRQAAGFRGADSARVISAEQHTGIRCRGCGSAPSSPAALSFSATPLVAAIDVRRDLTDRAMCEPRPGQQKSEGDGYICVHTVLDHFIRRHIQYSLRHYVLPYCYQTIGAILLDRAPRLRTLLLTVRTNRDTRTCE